MKPYHDFSTLIMCENVKKSNKEIRNSPKQIDNQNTLINSTFDVDTEQQNDPKTPFLILQVFENSAQLTNFSTKNLNQTKFNKEQVNLIL